MAVTAIPEQWCRRSSWSPLPGAFPGPLGRRLAPPSKAVGRKRQGWGFEVEKRLRRGGAARTTRPSHKCEKMALANCPATAEFCLAGLARTRGGGPLSAAEPLGGDSGPFMTQYQVRAAGPSTNSAAPHPTHPGRSAETWWEGAGGKQCVASGGRGGVRGAVLDQESWAPPATGERPRGRGVGVGGRPHLASQRP